MEQATKKIKERIDFFNERAAKFEQEAKICSAIADELVDLMVELEHGNKDSLPIPTPVGR